MYGKDTVETGKYILKMWDRERERERAGINDRGGLMNEHLKAITTHSLLMPHVVVFKLHSV